MPRMNLTEAEAEYIEAVRRKNTAAIAHNRAIELCKEVVRTTANQVEQLEKMEALQETLRP